MKKAVIVFLCVLFVFSFCACKGENQKWSHSVDVAYFAEMGKIPEIELKIGDAVPDNEALEKDGFAIFADESPAYISNGALNLYFDTEKNVITKIAGFDSFLGFEVGAISIEVTSALDEQNIKYTEREAKDGELFFLPSAPNRSIVECKGLKHSLIFVFENNALCAALLG